MLKYCLNRNKTQNCVIRLLTIVHQHENLFLICFLTNIMIQKLDNVVFFHYDIDPDDVDSGIVTLFSNDTGLDTLHLNSINLHDDNFDDVDPANFVLVRLKQREACKKCR